MTQLDATLVRALGLSDAAAALRRAAPGGRARAAHPLRHRDGRAAARAAHEPSRGRTTTSSCCPTDPATRAETAYSVAQILRFNGWETAVVEDAAATFELPQLGAWQTRVLNTAVRFVGFPYVWGGTSEKAEAPFGVQAHGGFDCSGFVWRVYKLQAYPGGAALAATLKGRTTYQMSGEVAARSGSRSPSSRPATSLFFGPPARARSRPRSTTPGSTSATAGSSTPPATASP